MRKRLLVDPFLGKLSCGRLSLEMDADCYTAPPISTVNWPALVSAALSELLGRATRWEAVIGIDTGAIVAAELIKRDYTKRAIVIDPFLAHSSIQESPDLLEALNSYNRVPYTQDELESMHRSLPNELTAGVFTDASIELMFRDRSTGEERKAYFDALSKSVHAREPIAPQGSIESGLAPFTDWMVVARETKSVQTLFSSTVSDQLIAALRNHLPVKTIRQMTWPRHAWITQARRVADDLVAVLGE